ncbi:myrosinase 1-like [Cydia fagiglandana]|uniref:myrosinase 1-like n=1 Tax=Cydia fagiglandana TaxID=1458189 RepID=UPI002FEE54BB
MAILSQATFLDLVNDGSDFVTASDVLVAGAAVGLRFPDGFQFGVATAAYQVEGAWNVSATVGLRFPDGFQFGVATAAYQVEGAWNVSDKTPSMWDDWTQQNPHKIPDGSTGDVACNSYNKWPEDIRMLKDLGVDYYRFSISWPRLLPTGLPNKISQDGARYYNQLIDALLRNRIQPYVTIYHWDMPRRIYNMGGWQNPLMITWFGDFARVVFSLFGDRVKTWLTINEPVLVCDVSSQGWGPGKEDPEIGIHLCARHVLLAHARAYEIYGEFRESQKGRLSIANQYMWHEPEDPGDEHIAELVRQYMIGRYTHPIFSAEGGWPPAVERHLAKNSRDEGHAISRLPPFSKQEVERIRGSFDFLAFNHYTSQAVRAARGGEAPGARGPMFDVRELGARTRGRAEWRAAGNGWLYVYPEGLRKLLGWLKQNYGDVEIIITENGYSTAARSLQDDDRLQYYRDYLKQLLLAIKEDGANVTAYTAWSLMDNFEWVDGYTSKFGIYDVDFSDPERKRRPRKSALFYRDVIRTRSLDVPDPHVKDEL